MMHSCKGYCFVDFACSGPYVDIDMHPAHDGAYLDAVFISPHKFLGGPGTPGIMVFNKKLYKNAVPDNCGGGTVVIPFNTITHAINKLLHLTFYPILLLIDLFY